MNKVLLIDIGGTNLRYAYSDGDLSSLYDTNKIQLSCIKGFNEILTNLVKDKDIDSLVISVAGPKINGSITMTNRDFSINEKDIKSKIELRNKARENKDYKEADRIRDELLDKGVLIEDKDGRTLWKFK